MRAITIAQHAPSSRMTSPTLPAMRSAWMRTAVPLIVESGSSAPRTCPVYGSTKTSRVASSGVVTVNRVLWSAAVGSVIDTTRSSGRACSTKG